MGGDTWACQPLTTRGSRKILIGIEVDRITTDFPMVDLQEATRDLKNSTDDQKIKDLRVPAQVGGHINVLLGIQYSAHFPKLVHSLESGLAIYEVRLLAGDPLITAAIAGPHHSFNMMLEKIGDTNATLVVFTQGLAQWKLFGPPPIQSMHLGTRDLEMAAEINIAEIIGLDDISEFNNNNTLPTVRICAEHITPLAEECLQHPTLTQKTTHKYRGRLLTDTREDILDSYDADDEQVTRTCCETNTAKAFRNRSNNTTTPCRSICCSGCQHTSCHQPIELNEQEYLKLSEEKPH